MYLQFNRANYNSISEALKNQQHAYIVLWLTLITSYVSSQQVKYCVDVAKKTKQVSIQ
jgi:hypothetical protein